MSNDRLRTALGNGPVLLDFDGPMCRVFAGLPAPRAAAELVEHLRAARVDVPASIAAEPDPLTVLRWTGQACLPEQVAVADDVLCALELRAVATAEPTSGGHAVVHAARAAGRAVAVVSNNSAGAVSAYLSLHDLAPHVAAVVGRAHGRPDQMKPNPTPILNAVRALCAKPADCVLIGDSLTDIEGAYAAGIRVIGYANRPYKIAAFRAADAVVTAMTEIAALMT